jgi:quercetin dioxygenase-like cupin family protein
MVLWLSMSLTAIVASFVFAQQEDDKVMRRLTPPEVAALAQGGPGAGSSGVAGTRSTVLYGDPTKAGLYTIRLSVPAHTRIEAHRHRDDRTVTVVSGAWSLGYGEHYDAAALKALPPGSFYTEPAGRPHFAQTGDATAVVYITGYGPTDTVYPEKDRATPAPR